MTEEMTPQTPQQTSSQHNPPKPRINLQELRNSDLVSRYLAATPPYLYSAPVGPHNFFFSEMLRSLVQARNNSEQTARNQVNQMSATLPGRRPRKRAWSSQRPIYEPSSRADQSEVEKPTASEKPLELTNKTVFPMTKYQKCESPKILTPENSIRNSNKTDQPDVKHIPAVEYPSNMSLNATTNRVNSAESVSVAVPPSELVLPPPPPMWYPPLYPPYGIDPLHFFIDLRVSGHIYDRKKENISPTSQVADNNNIIPSIDGDAINKHRHGSAFSVPKPRRDKSPSLALNLSSGSPKKSELNHTFEHGGVESVKNTNYVLQNLPRIYTHLSGHGGEERNSLNSDEMDCKSDCDVQDVDGRDDRSDENYDEMDDVVIVDNNCNKSEPY